MPGFFQRRKIRNYAYQLVDMADRLGVHKYVKKDAAKTYKEILDFYEKRCKRQMSMHYIYIYAIVVLQHEMIGYEKVDFKFQDQYFRIAYETLMKNVVGHPSLEASMALNHQEFRVFLDTIGKTTRDTVMEMHGANKYVDNVLDKYVYINEFCVAFMKIFNELYKECRKPWSNEYFGTPLMYD